MSGRGVIGRMMLAVGALLVLVLGLSAPTPGRAAVPLPQATTATASPGSSPSASSSASPGSSPSASGAEDEPDDELTDDGSNPTPEQTGTWLAVAAAAALSVAAGLVVVLRRR